MHCFCYGVYAVRLTSCVATTGGYLSCCGNCCALAVRETALQVHPVKGNVGFASAQSGWSFTLKSFAQLYADVYGVVMDTEKFMQRLWGDIYFSPETRKFSKKQEGDVQRTFIHFILEPLYKVYTQVLLPPHPPLDCGIDSPVGSYRIGSAGQVPQWPVRPPRLQWVHYLLELYLQGPGFWLGYLLLEIETTTPSKLAYPTTT